MSVSPHLGLLESCDTTRVTVCKLGVLLISSDRSTQFAFIENITSTNSLKCFHPVVLNQLYISILITSPGIARIWNCQNLKSSGERRLCFLNSEKSSPRLTRFQPGLVACRLTCLDWFSATRYLHLPALEKCQFAQFSQTAPQCARVLVAGYHAVYVGNRRIKKTLLAVTSTRSILLSVAA